MSRAPRPSSTLPAHWRNRRSHSARWPNTRSPHWLASPYYFFFPAEDGIRAKLVTGVQTCALPIFVRRLVGLHGGTVVATSDGEGRGRSEERRVGKECRGRWWPYRSTIESRWR